MTPVEARRKALIKLGGIEQTKEIYRDRRGFPLVESLIQDLRYGLRMLSKSPGFTAIALLTLALGIGGTTAIFSVVYGVLIDPWPYRDSDRLGVLHAHNTVQNWQNWALVSAPEWLDYRRQNHVFDEVIGGTFENVLMTGVDAPQDFDGSLVTTNTFRVLGVQPLLGRAFTDEDGKPGAPPVVVLGHKVWQANFGGDSGIIGKTLILNHQPTTVIGVMPPRLDTDMWLPTDLARRPAGGQYFVEGRLKAGVSYEQATADIAILAKRFAAVYPKDHPKDVTFVVESFTTAYTSYIRPTWFILLGAVSMLLLIACVNVANLLLARATVRQREFAIRASLGASHIRLIRQLLIESLLLALGGAILGCAVSQAALAGLLSIVPDEYIKKGEAVVRMNGTALLFALGTALISALLFGLTPALRAARADLQEPLKAKSRGAGDSRGHGRLRNLLIVSEVALSLVLLTGGGLLIRSFFTLRYADPGYDLDNVIGADVHLPEDRYRTAEQRNQFHLESLRRMRALPGVVSAALSWPPMRNGWNFPFKIAGKSSGEQPRAWVRFSGDRFFETLRIPLLQGRAISEADLLKARKVAVVNRAFVNRYFAGESPLGRQITVMPEEMTSFKMVEQEWFEIIGVVGDTRHWSATGPNLRPGIFLNYTVEGTPWNAILMRSTVGRARLANPIRRNFSAIDKELPAGVWDLRGELNQWYSEPRFVLTMLAAFGSLGLVLVSFGVYGVLAYHASQRTHEIGIRMALGAQGAEVRWLVLKAGLRSLLLGIAIGVPASIGLTKVLQNRIWGIKTADPLTLGAVVLVLAAVGLAAAYFPARRATQVDPMVALRFE